MKNIICILIVSFCALSCAKLSIPKDQQVKIAIAAACKTLELGQCFDEPVLQSVFNGINENNCISRVENKELIFSTKDMRNLKKPSCGKAFKGLGL